MGGPSPPLEPVDATPSHGGSKVGGATRRSSGSSKYASTLPGGAVAVVMEIALGGAKTQDVQLSRSTGQFPTPGGRAGAASGTKEVGPESEWKWCWREESVGAAPFGVGLSRSRTGPLTTCLRSRLYVRTMRVRERRFLSGRRSGSRRREPSCRIVNRHTAGRFREAVAHGYVALRDREAVAIAWLPRRQQRGLPRRDLILGRDALSTS
jgi:hypothetical protein